MRVDSYDIVMMTKLKIMMKPLRDSLQGLLLWSGDYEEQTETAGEPQEV